MGENRELLNNMYRLAVLGHFTPGYTNMNDQIRDPRGRETVASKIENGLAVVKMRMPDGSLEYWRQTDLKVDGAASKEARELGTGFKAMAFERCNKDGNLYFDEDRKPQVMVIFPGNTAMKQDRDTTAKLLRGQNLEPIYRQTETFVAGLLHRFEERAAHGKHDMPGVTIAAHSIGDYSLAAGMQMRKAGIDVKQTVLYEPVGAGQALQQLTEREAKKMFGNPTAEQKMLVANALTLNTFSIRADKGTLFHENGGNNDYDNIMIGRTYLYKSEGGPAGAFMDHMFPAPANAALRFEEDALIKTQWNDKAPGIIAGGGRPLEDWEKKWAADIKGDAFDKLTGPTARFNRAAALELHQNVNDKKPDFSDLKFASAPDTLKTPFDPVTPAGPVAGFN